MEKGKHPPLLKSQPAGRRAILQEEEPSCRKKSS